MSLNHRTRLFITGNQLRHARGHAVVNDAPCLLDTQFVAQLLIGSSTDGRGQQSQWSPFKPVLQKIDSTCNIGFPNFLWQSSNPLKRRWLSAAEQASTGNH